MPAPVSETVSVARSSVASSSIVSRPPTGVVQGVDQEIVGELFQLVVIPEDHLLLLAQTHGARDTPLRELRLDQLQRLSDGPAKVYQGLRTLAGPAQRGHTLEQPLEPFDLAMRDAAELLEPAAVLQAEGDQ